MNAAASPSTRWPALGVLATGLAMIVLDGTIVGVALPTIVADLRLDLTDAQWVNSSYAVVFAALLLGFGRLGDALGRRRLFIAGVALFVAGSLLAVWATGASGLIGARIVQGVGGAALLPATLSTVNAVFRGRDRAVAFGIWGAVMSGAAALGPLLGGVLTEYTTWRAIFLINVPIGAAVIVGALYAVPETRAVPQTRAGAGASRAAHAEHPRAIDAAVGALLSALGFGLLVFGLIEGGRLGWWQPVAPLVVGGFTWSVSAPVSAAPVALALGAVVLLAFVRHETRLTRLGTPALLDMSLFRLATFRWGNVAAGAVAVGEFALVFVLPLYLTLVLHESALVSGFVLAAMALGALVAGASARHLSARFGAPTVVLLGLALEVVGASVTALTVAPARSPWLIAAPLVVYGIGLGLASAQLTSTVLADVPVAESGMGSATQSTVRQVGSALGTAAAGAVLAVLLGDAGLRASPDTFSTATAASIWMAVAFLLVGLLAATRVRRAAVEITTTPR